MGSLELEFPGPSLADTANVRTALTEAAEQWRDGDKSRALEALKRAAAAAEASGSDLRAVELARAAVHLAARALASIPAPPRLPAESDEIEEGWSEPPSVEDRHTIPHAPDPNAIERTRSSASDLPGMAARSALRVVLIPRAGATPRVEARLLEPGTRIPPGSVVALAVAEESGVELSDLWLAREEEPG